MKDLSPGASSRTISRWQKEMGCSLPADVQAFYRRHNGQAGKASTGPFFGLHFLPLSRAHQSWRSWRDLLERDPAMMREIAEGSSRSNPPSAIKPDYANTSWIPFAHDHGGNYLGLDLDPGPLGTHGQVINFGRDEDAKFVLAPSFGEFFAWLVHELEAGNAMIRVEDDGGRSLNTKRPKTRHFLASVPKLFSMPRRPR